MTKVYAKARNNDPTLPFNARQKHFRSGRGFAVDIRVRDWQGDAADRYAEGAIIGFWESAEDAERVAGQVNSGDRYRPGHPFHGRAYSAIVVPAWNVPAEPGDEFPWETRAGSAEMVAAYENAGVPLPQWLRAVRARLTADARSNDEAAPTADDDLREVIDPQALLDSLHKIRRETHAGQRSQYQFLVLLWAIAGARQGRRLSPYRAVRQELSDILAPFKLADSAPNPANPWYALHGSDWWELEAPLPRSYKEVNELNSVAGLRRPVFKLLASDEHFAARAVESVAALAGDNADVQDLIVSLELSGIAVRLPSRDELPERVPVESHAVERFTAECKAMASEERERREAKLQSAYLEFLIAKGHKVSRYKIPIDRRYLYTDLYDETTDDLIEVKASSDRVTMRLALGQILDYARLVKPALRTVVVPRPPTPGIIDLYSDHDVRIAWPAGFDGFHTAGS